MSQERQYELVYIAGPDSSEEQLAELQTALGLLGYPVGEIDGLIGPKTRNAWAEFKTDVFEGNPALIGAESIATLRRLVDGIGNTAADDFSARDGTIEAIKRECRAQDVALATQIAYVLATVQWETAQTFRPVREAFWLSEDWRRRNLRYYPYYGRGFVQITWKNNYEKYSKLLGVDLVNNPDLAMEPGSHCSSWCMASRPALSPGARSATTSTAARPTSSMPGAASMAGTMRTTSHGWRTSS